jgi:hypothetical protein
MSEIPHRACDLCGLPVETDAFSVLTTSGPKQFCCEGCDGVYRMLHEAELVLDNGNDAAKFQPRS